MTGLILQLDCTQLFFNVIYTHSDNNKKPPELKIVSLLHYI